MPIFQKSVLKKHLEHQDSKVVDEAFEDFSLYFHNHLIQQNIRNINEEQYQAKFLDELFVNIFGYILNPKIDYNLTTEFKNKTDSKKADGAILKDEKAVGVIELKSTNVKSLEKIKEQAFNYKNNQSECRYVITSNFEKIRFYIDNATEYNEYNLFTLTKEEFAELYLILYAENLLNDLPLRMKEETKFHEENISKQFYTDYSVFKKKIFDNLVKNNPQYDKLLLFKKSQKFLDRLLFIFFAEDTGLVPPNAISRIIDRQERLIEDDEYKTIYYLYKKLFHHLDVGFKYKSGYELPAYNGGLFAPDDVLDNVKIDDEILKMDSLKLSAYDFSTDVDVNILGHIFEHSLSEIEQITAEIEGVEQDNKGKRKKDGIFYTPKYITQYIVKNTVGKLCSEKKIELDINEIDLNFSYWKRNGKVSEKGKKLYKTLNEYKEWLLSLKIVDPACGSGAFLNQALNFLITEHNQIDEIIAELTGDKLGLFDTDVQILENNLYGVDINEESVEIAKLSLWLRTAKVGRKLSILSNNIKCGNSLIDDPEVAGDKAFNWQREFPEIFANGGFDVVIGNPPYVVKIGMTESEYFRNYYETTQGKKYDLFRFFIEKGLKLLGNKALLGYITPDVFLNLKQASELRKYILSNYSITQVLKAPLDVFNASVESVLFIIEKPKLQDNLISYRDVLTEEILNTVKQEGLLKGDYNIEFTTELSNVILEKIHFKSNRLGEIMTWKKGLGVYSRQHLANKFSKDEVENIMNNRPWTKDYKVDDTFGKEILGKDVHRYDVEWNGKKWLSYGPWLAFQRPIEFFKGPRLLVREITSEGKYNVNAAYVEEEYFNNQSIFNGVLKQENNEVILKYLLALLNSKLFSYYVLASSPKFNRKLFPTILMENIENFPIINDIDLGIQIRVANKVNNIINVKVQLKEIKLNFILLLRSKCEIEKISKKLQNWQELDFKDFLKELKKAKVKLSLSEEAEWMQYFNEQKQKAQELKSEIDKTDKEIDQMVYELYGLTEEEIEIVENS